MDKMPHMADMSLDEEDKKELGVGQPLEANTPKYPWGLAIRLTQHELEKIGVEHGDWQVGDMFHLHALAKITSISEHESEHGKNCCVEMQIIALAGESEDAENQEEEQQEEPEQESMAAEEPAQAKRRRNHYF